MTKLIIRDQIIKLLPERGVLWEEEKTLIIADIHLGKVALFQKEGIAIPEGSMEEDLLAIGSMIKQTQAKKCIIVGDLIHAKKGLSSEVVRQFSEWQKKTDCEIHLVVGNHDYSLLKKIPEEWSLHLHKESWAWGPFLFSHFPLQHPELFVWAGHIHPKVEIKSRGDRLILRCFQIYKNLGVLPALGSFVGGAFVKKSDDCEIYVIADDEVLRLG